MRKFTLMKWTFAFVAALFAVIPANAAVESVADLYGTYKFTSTMTVTEAGESYKDYFKGECDVVITSDSYKIYDGAIQGLAGATLNNQMINGIDTEKKTIKITNPNGNGLWEGGLYMSNAEGIYPFGGTYSGIEYAYDDATKTITLPDFTLVKCDHAASSATIIASFKDVKFTLVQAETIEVVDLSGDWHFTAGKGTYDVMEGSTLPTEFDMTLTATDEAKRNYSISMKLGDFAPLSLEATFDGVKLTIPFNETYFDAENKIGIVNMYGQARPGEIEFNLVNENTLSLYSGMVIAQDSISPEVKGGYLQWYMSGTAAKQGAETPAVSWDGVYKVKVGSTFVMMENHPVPTEFEMEVQYFPDWGIYLVTKFMDWDVVNLNNGGILFTPSADDPNKAEIATNALLKSIVPGEEYLSLLDMNLSNSPLTLTRLEDGTYTINDFCVAYRTYGSEGQKDALATFCQNVTATKQDAVEEPQPEPFNWANTFTVNAGNISVYNNAYTYPNNFEMVVEYNEGWQMYLVTKFFGADVTGLNYGGITLTPSADNPKMATINTNAFLSTIEPGSFYFKMFDMNASNTPLTVTVNEDGTLSIDDFCVSLCNFNTNETNVAALYSKVTATVGYTPAPEVGGDSNVIYSWESPEGTPVEKGGKMEYLNGDGSSDRLNYANANYHTICLNGKYGEMGKDPSNNASYMMLTLDQALQTGDVIEITGYRNKNADGKNATIYFLFENGTEWKDDKTFVNICADDNDEDYDDDGNTPNTNTWEITAAEAGSKTIKLSRNSASTNIFLTKFIITRGGTDGIADVEVVTPVLDNAIYNLSGQKVDASYKGIVIKNGKKYFVK